MSAANWGQLGLLVITLAVICPLLGRYLAAVFGDGPAPGDRWLGRIERRVLRWCRVDPDAEQHWKAYAASVLAFSATAIVALYGLQRLQGLLPLNPDDQSAVGAATAWNTAVSFVTNTNWQSYAGESTMSHLTQMAGLAVQNFVSAAAGIAVAVALVRGLVRSRSNTIGNFWVDLTRTVTRVLLPIAALAAIVLGASGVVQNLSGQRIVTTVEGATQSIPGGPIASQVAIKQLGTNGGGFLNANSAHPFENPTTFTNFLHLVLILAIPFALAFAFGRLAGDRRQGWVVAAAMATLLAVGIGITTWAETSPNPQLTAAGADQVGTSDQSAGSMEGKEVRFGTAGCALYAPITTGTSTGAVDCAHDSMSPAGGGAALFSILLGEVSPGGVGSGLYGMLVFVLLAVFIAGLMVGRTPEYLGKRIQAAEVKLVVLYILFVPFAVLVFSAISIVSRFGLEGLLNQGPHGLSEMVYAFASAGNKNGSAFGGLTVTNTWYETTLGLSMLIGRFTLMVPVLAIAGSLGRKQKVPASAGTFPTGTPLFAGLLVGVVVIVVGLTYFPVLALGPLVEHLGL
ncbi:MAG TPA: potassium-transporting ATPase subunit KdpA [Microthrixaceae bacterium]|nr:potassium-transporting ATPase subunit KdpA [Microthrixaceae bacterium]HMT24951.1 potassium-transporting ATPase subunit KdpA [Microthrixaceae bacterium]HMT61238.1 potassium-transporting ATPase subunit KdpA [Microthrixaceae bacterium]